MISLTLNAMVVGSIPTRRNDYIFTSHKYRLLHSLVSLGSERPRLSIVLPLEKKEPMDPFTQYNIQAEDRALH